MFSSHEFFFSLLVIYFLGLLRGSSVLCVMREEWGGVRRGECVRQIMHLHHVYKAHCVGEVFSVAYTGLEVWVYTALFAVLSFGIFWACIVCTLVNQCYCCAVIFHLPLLTLLSAHQSICCQSARSCRSYLFAVGMLELWCLSAAVNPSPIAPQQITFILPVKPVMYHGYALGSKISICASSVFSSDPLCALLLTCLRVSRGTGLCIYLAGITFIFHSAVLIGNGMRWGLEL